MYITDMIDPHTRRWQRLAGTLLFLVLIVMTLLPAMDPGHAAEKSKTVRVGWYESPFNMIDKKGNRSGYAYEYQQKIAAYTGWDYKYAEGGWYGLLEDLKKGKIDLMTDVSRTPEREDQMLFSDRPMGSEVYYVIVMADNKEIHSDDTASLNGKRVGIAKDSIQEDQFREWEKKHNVKANIVELEGDDITNVHMLEQGKLDAYLGVGGFEDYLDNAVPIFMTGSSDYYFAINKDRPDLKKQIDSAMMEINSANWAYSRDLAEKYLSHAGAQRFLTADENKWLKKHGTIRVGYLSNFLPFCSQSQTDGQVSGLLKDFLSASESSMKNAKIQFQTTAYERPKEMYEALANGSIDAIFPISISVSQAEKLNILQTDSLTQTELLAVVRQKDVGKFDPTKKHSVAVVGEEYVGTSVADGYFPDWKQISAGSLDRRLAAVESGKADCVLMSNYQYYTEMRNLENRHLTTIATGQNPAITFGVSKSQLPLYAIMTKLTNAITDAEVYTSLARYTNYQENISLGDFVRGHLALVLGSLVMILIAIAVLLFLSLRSGRRTKRLNRELMESQAREQVASAAKTNFLFNMSHDIRTPMNAIVGYSDLAIRHPGDESLRADSLKKIHSASEQLLNLVNDILDMSRIESGKMEVQLQPASLTAAETNLQSVFGAQAEAKKLSFRVDTNQIRHDVVTCDPKLLNRIIMNLLSNSMKFTPEGGQVCLTVEELGSTPSPLAPLEEIGGQIVTAGELNPPAPSDGAVYRFTVRDTGIGMSEDFLSRIFEPFERERTSTVSRQQGTGLGMAIVKTLVELLHGRITIQSAPNRGSCFTIDLPLDFSSEAPDNAGPTGREMEHSFEGKTVLLVEDMPVNMELARILLQEQKLSVVPAENGQVALETFRAEPDRFDAILMDIQMPFMDGYEATRQIRALEDPHAQTVPIIAMTANAFAEDKQKAMDTGMNGHISKPIDVQQLNRTLHQFL